MKNYLIIAAMIIAGVSLSSCGPTRVVAARPADVIYTRPAAPGPGYVWIDGNWYWRGGSYQWQQGRWNQARPGRNWQQGNWIQTRRGWKWNKGRWR